MEIACLDLEGVLVPEIWIAFAEHTGIAELRATTRDIPDYDVLMQQRLRLLDQHGFGLPQIQEVIAQLKTWANSDLAPCPLTMRSENPSFDNQLVFIDPASIQPALEVVSVKKISKLIGSLTLYEA